MIPPLPLTAEPRPVPPVPLPAGAPAPVLDPRAWSKCGMPVPYDPLCWYGDGDQVQVLAVADAAGTVRLHDDGDALFRIDPDTRDVTVPAGAAVLGYPVTVVDGSICCDVPAAAMDFMARPFADWLADFQRCARRNVWPGPVVPRGWQPYRGPCRQLRYAPVAAYPNGDLVRLWSTPRQRLYTLLYTVQIHDGGQTACHTTGPPLPYYRDPACAGILYGYPVVLLTEAEAAVYSVDVAAVDVPDVAPRFAAWLAAQAHGGAA